MCSTQALLTRCLVLPLQLQRKLFVDTSEDRQLAPLVAGWRLTPASKENFQSQSETHMRRVLLALAPLPAFVPTNQNQSAIA